jgi:hypothetical protein
VHDAVEQPAGHVDEALFRRLIDACLRIHAKLLDQPDRTLHASLRCVFGDRTKCGVAVERVELHRERIGDRVAAIARRQQHVPPTVPAILALGTDVGLRYLPRVEDRPEQSRPTAAGMSMITGPSPALKKTST